LTVLDVVASPTRGTALYLSPTRSADRLVPGLPPYRKTKTYRVIGRVIRHLTCDSAEPTQRVPACGANVSAMAIDAIPSQRERRVMERA
jgi:hypothetical protein